MKGIRVLVTASTFPSYDDDAAPRFVLDLCRSIQATGGSECLVVAPHSKEAALNETMEGIQVRRYRYMIPDSLEMISGSGITAKVARNNLLILLVPFFLFFQLLATARAVKDFNPNIILANWIVPQGLVAAITKMLFPRLRIIIVSHGGDAAIIQRGSIMAAIGRSILSRADRIVAVSTFIRDKITSVFPAIEEEVSVIPMGVDSDLFEECRSRRSMPADEEERILLFVGRLEAKKGVDHLLRAMPRVIKRYPHVTLKIVGQGTSADSLQALTGSLGIGGNVVFHGAVEHKRLPTFFEKATICVLPSVNTKSDVEGVPVVLLEAMAAGIPVVTTDAGGIGDLVEDGVTGLMAEQGNAERLAERILELLDDRELREHLSQRAYKRIKEHFTYPVIGQRFREIIRSVASSRPRSTG